MLPFWLHSGSNGGVSKNNNVGKSFGITGADKRRETTSTLSFFLCWWIEGVGNSERLCDPKTIIYFSFSTAFPVLATINLQSQQELTALNSVLLSIQVGLAPGMLWVF